MTTPTRPIPAHVRRPGQGRRARPRQRGVAIIAVLVALSVVMVIGNEFSTNTNVDLTAAANHRDAMRAQFLASSALNLSELVIRLQQRLDNVKQLGGIQITDFADQLMLAFCGSAEEVKDAIGLPTDQVKGLGADIGTCGAVAIDTDDGKINLNCANGNATTVATLKTRLDALMFFPAYDPIFQEEDATGWRRDRELQATALIDYVDKDRGRHGTPGASEDYGYESRKDEYKAKDNYLDTVGEIRQIRGVDDRFWTVFGNALTVHGGCKSNVGAVRDPNLIASLIYLAAKDPADPVVQDPNRLWTLAGLVAQARNLGLSFGTLEDFIEFVKDPAAAMAAGTAAAGDATGQTPQLPGIAPGTKVGVELDPQKLGQIAEAGPRRTYRVEVYGEIDRKAKYPDGTPIYPAIRRSINAVWDTKVVTQNARNPQVKNGTWVYLRED